MVTLPVIAYVLNAERELRYWAKLLVKSVLKAYTDIPTSLYGGINIKQPNYLKKQNASDSSSIKKLSASPNTHLNFYVSEFNL